MTHLEMMRKILDESQIDHSIGYAETDGSIIIQFVPNGCDNTILIDFSADGTLQTFDTDVSTDGNDPI
jgi:hypothetical protein